MMMQMQTDITTQTPLHNETQEVQTAMQTLEEDLNILLGFGWWKKYVAAAFWSNVSTPVNLAITMLTALTTAQATSPDLFPEKTYIGMSITALVLSVLNTFFRPHTQMSENIKLMNRWNELGLAYEAIYYSDCNTQEDYARRLTDYRKLHMEINVFKSQQSPESQNFLTDLVHIVARGTCLRKKDRWMDLAEV